MSMVNIVSILATLRAGVMVIRLTTKTVVIKVAIAVNV